MAPVRLPWRPRDRDSAGSSPATSRGTAPRDPPGGPGAPRPPRRERCRCPFARRRRRRRFGCPSGGFYCRPAEEIEWASGAASPNRGVPEAGEHGDTHGDNRGGAPRGAHVGSSERPPSTAKPTASATGRLAGETFFSSFCPSSRKRAPIPNIFRFHGEPADEERDRDREAGRQQGERRCGGERKARGRSRGLPAARRSTAPAQSAARATGDPNKLTQQQSSASQTARPDAQAPENGSTDLPPREPDTSRPGKR